MTGIGSLRRRLELQREKLVPDGEGGFAAAWTLVAELWGEVVPAGVARSVNADRRITHIIRIRNNQDIAIKTGMRVFDGKRAFLVREVTEFDSRGRWLEIRAEEYRGLGDT